MVSFSLVAAVVAAASLVKADPSFLKPKLLGCYHSSKGLTFNDTYTFQSSGYCQTQCGALNATVLAMTGSQDCWCGDTMPPLDTKVDATFCNATCSGYPADLCGSADGTYFSVWNSGINATVLNYGATPSSSSDSSATSSASPSVVTVGGQTHTITAAPTAKSSGGGSTNKAAVAAGVIVGLIAIAGLCGGGYFFMRRKQRREMEDEIKRQAAISSFMQAGKPGSSGGMSSTDSRLDPTIMTRRQSDGSIADNQDYSRRILKVTNA